MAKPTSEKNRERLARLEELGFEWDDEFDAHEGETLVTVIGEGRADPPDPLTVEEAERDLAAALAEIERDLAADGAPETIERVAERARRVRERYADALNTTARPASTTAEE